MDCSKRIFEKGDILVEDSKIIAIGNVESELIKSNVEIIDANGKIIMPGLVNTHVHLSQQLARGLADDVDLLTWLRKRIWPYESNMDLEDSYISSLACCTELIRSGVTTFCEAGGQEVDGMGKAVEEAGLRGILCRSTMDCGDGLPLKWQETTEESLQNK
ncbi:amidohydrolase family protein [Clostridium botulinum]|nr:amidohydrolase family protein [Clostridium botulinum]